MENLELAKLVYKQVTEFPETFDMSAWGYQNKCGTSACIAGHAMLLSGYGLLGENVFVRPDGSPVHNNTQEALSLLGMDDDEYYRDSARPGTIGFPLFGTSNANAIRRLGELIAAAEHE